MDNITLKLPTENTHQMLSFLANVVALDFLGQKHFQWRELYIQLVSGKAYPLSIQCGFSEEGALQELLNRCTFWCHCQKLPMDFVLDKKKSLLTICDPDGREWIWGNNSLKDKGRNNYNSFQ